MIGESNVTEKESVVRIASSIIAQAIRDDASEICIEWANSRLVAWIRVGEEWQELMTLPYHMHGPMIERFKEMADVDASCVTRSQEGRIAIEHEGNDYMIALRAAPTFIGELVGMRLEAA